MTAPNCLESFLRGRGYRFHFLEIPLIMVICNIDTIIHVKRSKLTVSLNKTVVSELEKNTKIMTEI